MNTNAFRQCVIASLFFAFFSSNLQASEDLVAGNGDGTGPTVGSVTVTDEGGTLSVAVAVNYPFLVVEAHAAAAATCDEIPQTGKGNPKVGHFEASWVDFTLPGSDSADLVIDNVYDEGTVLCVAVHAVIYDSTAGADPEEALNNSEEGAWAAGEGFPGKSWATHFEFTTGGTGGPSCQDGASCIVFVSSQAYSGDLVSEAVALGDFTGDGLAAADALCNDLAGPGGANLPGTFTAWLSDSSTDAIDRVTNSSKPYYLTDGTTRIADDFSDLLTCNNPFCLQTGIVKDESAGGPAAPPDSYRIWTGTGVDGLLDGSGDTCGNWGSGDALDSGRAGSASVSSVWTTRLSQACDNSGRLYCFQD